jgi:hypothetical protein
MSALQRDPLHTFIENERKAKVTTLISVAGFLLCVAAILFLAVRLKKQNEEINRLKGELSAALFAADSMVNALEQNRVSLTLEKAVEALRPNHDAAAVSAPRYSLRSNLQRRVVYIQYKASYRDVDALIEKQLAGMGYHVPASQRIDRINYASSVRYFHDSDREQAEQIASLVNQTLSQSGKGVAVLSKNELKAPAGQFEIWLGDLEEPDQRQLINRYVK